MVLLIKGKQTLKSNLSLSEKVTAPKHRDFGNNKSP